MQVVQFDAVVHSLQGWGQATQVELLSKNSTLHWQLGVGPLFNVVAQTSQWSVLLELQVVHG